MLTRTLPLLFILSATACVHNSRIKLPESSYRSMGNYERAPTAQEKAQQDAHRAAFFQKERDEEIAAREKRGDFSRSSPERQKAEADHQAAARLAEMQRERTEARRDGTCLPGDTDEVCDLKAQERAHIEGWVQNACNYQDELSLEEAAARKEREDAKRFGVVNLAVLQNAKENAAMWQEKLDDAKAEILRIRGKGKAFSYKRECHQDTITER